MAAKTKPEVKVDVSIAPGPATPGALRQYRRAWARLAAKAREQAGNEATK
jgi:hypothetical protein